MWVAVFVDQLDEEEVRLGVPLGSGHGEWKAGVSDRGCCDGCLVDGSRRDGSSEETNLFGFALMVWETVYSLVEN